MIQMHNYLGSYGICKIARWVLLSRKVRGPYAGLMDLPGGHIRFGEDPERVLRREFLKETGLNVSTATLQSAFSKVIDYRGDDVANRSMHHIGLLFSVTLEDGESGVPPLPRSESEGEDSESASWLLVAEIDPNTLTPFARMALFGSDGSPARLSIWERAELARNL